MEEETRPPTSRLIVKNIPKKFTDLRLREKFSKFGMVTDAKMIVSHGKPRQFAYVGFKSEADATKAKEYFNDTYFDTNKVAVEYAYPQDSPFIPRAWSRHTAGSSAYTQQHKAAAKKLDPKKKEEEPDATSKLAEVEKKKSKFKSFLEYMAKKKTPRQSWNDVFNSYAPEEGKGATKTGKEDSSKKEEAKSVPEEQKTEKMVDGKVVPEEKKEEEGEEIDDKRLYVMNLPFEASEQELIEKFSAYGNVEAAFIPRDYRTNMGKGYAYITFTTPESSIDAYANLDKSIFQGRKLHILPAQKHNKPPTLLPPPLPFPQPQLQGETAPPPAAEKKPAAEGDRPKREKSTFKAKKKESLKKNYDEETNWNYLFINPNTVATAMANKLNVTKGELLSRDADNAAVRMALSETHIIKETKDWLKANGVNVGLFDGESRRACKRSNKILLFKNISDKTGEKDLRELFERFGTLTRLLLAPSNTLGLVEYGDPNSAATAMKKNAYHILNGLPLYIEYAPEGLIKEEAPKPVEEKKKDTPMEEQKTEEGSVKYGRTIFVKNLNFTTVEAKLADTFESAKVGKIVSVRIVKNSKDKTKSMGYGFVEYATEESAVDAIKTLQNVILDEHSLKLSISKKKLADRQVKEQRSKLKRKAVTEADNPEAEKATGKLMVKNLAFEATRKDLVQMFDSFGKVKKIRIPKKFDGTHRGFAFVEFFTKEDAKNAFKNLQSSHLYGRKLVLQWAKDETLTTEQLQEKTEAKFGALSSGNPKGVMVHGKAELTIGGKRKKLDE